MRLRGITVGNFRSISGRIEVPIGRMTYLIGPNGAGKSNILDAMPKIAAIFLGKKYVPKPGDYFDNDDDNNIELGATFELSDKEQFKFLKHRIGFPIVTKSDLGPDSPFRFLKCLVTLGPKTRRKDEIWLSINKYKFEKFVRASLVGRKLILSHRDIEKIDVRGTTLPPMTYTSSDRSIPTADLFSLVDPSLHAATIHMLDNMTIIGTDRKIPSKVPVRESKEISPDGQNLPNELNDLLRAEQSKFDKRMKSVTHGDPTSVEPRTTGSDLVLEIHESGLTRRANHTDLGSGQLQTLILGWRAFQRDGAVIAVLKEPEMHLHAERQKQVLQLIRDKSKRDGSQFIIETHSPIFLGTEEDEIVLLATKSKGRTSIARIAPENMHLIREELGVSHADALYNPRVLFVEGESEFAAFPIFWKAIRPGIGPAPVLFSLGGAGNTKHLRLILEYLKADDRRFFAILDRHDDAMAHAKNLPTKLLPRDSLHILKGSFEDEFTSGQIARAANRLAGRAGLDLRLTPAELDAAGRKGGVIKAVKRRWFEAAGTTLNKTDLAVELARLYAGGKTPKGIRVALEAAATSLGAPGAAAGPKAKPAAAASARERRA